MATRDLPTSLLSVWPYWLALGLWAGILLVFVGISYLINPGYTLVFFVDPMGRRILFFGMLPLSLLGFALHGLLIVSAYRQRTATLRLRVLRIVVAVVLVLLLLLLAMVILIAPAALRISDVFKEVG